MSKQYFITNLETMEKKPVQLNAVINNIRLYIQINLLSFGMYAAITDGRQNYIILDRFSKKPVYSITKG